MRVTTGQSVKNFTLPSLDGALWELDSLQGTPYLLAFFRFASCPFCNLRVHQLISYLDQLPDDFTVVAVFESPLKDLQRYAGKHQAAPPMLADEGGKWHSHYGIEHSWTGLLKGMLLRLPTLLYAMFGKGYLPFSVKGSMNTMPADFLVDRHGIIQEDYYGQDEGDHIPLARIRKLALEQTKVPALKLVGQLYSE